MKNLEKYQKAQNYYGHDFTFFEQIFRNWWNHCAKKRANVKFSDNHGHNILERCKTLEKFELTTSNCWLIYIYSTKNFVWVLPTALPNDLRITIFVIFFLSGLSFTNMNTIHRTVGQQGRRGTCLLNSSLPLPPASQTLSH